MGTRTWEVKINDRTFRMKLAKARAEALSRRIKDASIYLPQHCREISTGDDGKEYSSTSMVLFGRGQAPVADPEAWQSDINSALDKWAAAIITESNLTECGVDFATIYNKHVPVLDKRRTADQIAAERRDREEARAAREAKEKADLSAFLGKFSTGRDAQKVSIPDGHMAVYLSVTYDNSDSMTDYFDPHRSVGTHLLLATVPAQAQTQSIARQSVGRYGDLAAVTTWKWHTENYSMGHGNYLESGYETSFSRLDKLHDGGEQERPCKFEVLFDKYVKAMYPYKGYPGISVQPSNDESSEPISTASATISRNTAKDGIEIRFSDRPSDDILSRLKAARWRWSRFSKCWYTRYSESAMSFATELVNPPPTALAAETAPTASEVFKSSPAEEDDDGLLTAEDMASITGQEWTEEAMEQFKACC